MPTIDDKVVAMSFESSKFESGVNNTIKAIDKLKTALTFKGSTQGFADIHRASKDVQLGHIGQSLDDIHQRLGALRLAAIAVFADIARHALAASKNFIKAFTLDPIQVGMAEYETKLNSVQTILANTQAAGVGLEKVNSTLQELNEYSDKTIYNFGQMARNIGTFTAAGVELDTATGAIKGIANLAALSGSNSEQASTAMYQLSQAIAAGRVSLMDWNSVVNAGMGGTVFQRALAQTAESMGTLKKGTVELVGPMKNVKIQGESFRNSLAAAPGQQSWLTSDVLTSTLKQFTGDLKDAELAAMGFNKQQIAAIQMTAQTAMKAATEVKTWTQLLGVAKETAGSGWAETWQLILGDFNEAKKLFTDLSNVINGFINANADARNAMLSGWKDLGGRRILIDGIRIAFNNLKEILIPIKEAFRDIFPPMTGKDLLDLTLKFKAFMYQLRPSEETIENLRRTFRGLFAVLKIAGMIIGGVVGVIGDLLGAAGKGSGGFLAFTAGIGDWLTHLYVVLQQGDKLERFFDGISRVLQVPLELLGALKDALDNVFSGFDSGGISGAMGGMGSTIERVTDLWERFLEAIGEAGKIIGPVIEAYIKGLARVGDALVTALENMDFNAALQVVKTGLIGGIFLMFKKFLGKGAFSDQLAKGFAGLGGGLIKNISGSFKALEGSMVAMQQNIKADTLQKIAIAIAILVASIIALTFVDVEELQKSLTAITIAFGQLLGAMAILTVVGKTAGFVKIPIIAASLILLAGAILVLSASVVILGQLDWDSLLKGLVGVGILLGIITIAVIPLSANSAGMVRAGIGIAAIGVGLLILATAVHIMARMSWGEMSKGLIGVAVGLGILVAATAKMPRGGMVGIGLGLILVAASLLIIASAVEKFGEMNWSTMGKGMLGLAASLGIIAVALKLMPKPKAMIVQAAALLILSLALQGIVRAVSVLGGMSFEQLAKGLISLAAALGILAGALYVMSATITGAIALGLTAAALALFIPQLLLLGSLSWGQILTGLIALAGALAIIGLAGALIAPVVLPLMGLGVAILLIGAGFALIGAGLAAIAWGLSALVVAFPSGVGVMLAAITAFQKGLIENIKLLILGLLEIVQGIADVAPEFVTAIVDILNSMIDAIIQIVPKIVELFQVLIDAIIQLLADNQDSIIQAAFDLIIALLTGIRNNLYQITTLVIEIIVALIKGLADNVDILLGAGLNLLLALIQGIADNVTKLATAGADIIVQFINALGRNYGKIVTAGTNFIIKLITGIGNNAGRLVTAGVNAVLKFIEGLGKNAVKLADGALKVVLQFLRGLKKAVDDNIEKITEAVVDIGEAIIAGIIRGLWNSAGDLADAIIDIARDKLPGWAKDALEIFNPSRVFMDIGEAVMEGWARGITDNVGLTKSAVTDATDTMIKSINDIPFDDLIDMNPVITPILDLTQVEGKVGELARLTDVSPIAAAMSRKAASAISVTNPALEEEMAAAGGSSVIFEQNNYSPKALSEVEIYRQTRNQLSQIKSALAVT